MQNRTCWTTGIRDGWFTEMCKARNEPPYSNRPRIVSKMLGYVKTNRDAVLSSFSRKTKVWRSFSSGRFGRGSGTFSPPTSGMQLYRIQRK